MTLESRIEILGWLSCEPSVRDLATDTEGITAISHGLSENDTHGKMII